jgi:hypothetical protein
MVPSPTWAKSSRDPISKIPNRKKGFTLEKQALYSLSHTSSPKSLFQLILKVDSCEL